MKRMRRIVIVVSLVCSITAPCLWAAMPENPQGWVSDFAGILSEDTKSQISGLIDDVKRSTGAEIAVVTVSSLDGMTVEEYAVRLFEKWGIGAAEEDNGVLFLIAPNERKTRIEVGYGLEPVITDGRAGEIIRETILPFFRAGDYNQAIMDLGATLCTPKAPDCDHCPLNEICQARALGIQEARPVSAPKAKIPHHTVTAAVIQSKGRVMIVQRPTDGLLGGMWEFPGGKQEPGEELTTCLQREILEELGAEIQVGEPFGVYEHAYTHFKVTLHAFHCRLNGTEPQIREHTDLRWVVPTELDDFPMGKIDRQIASNLQKGITGC